MTKNSGRLPFLAALGLASAGSALPAADGTPPSGFGPFEAHGDVGAVTLPGSAGHDPERQEFTVVGSGGNMWFAKDEFHFVWKRMKGNFILRARARFVGEGVEKHRKLGWIARASLATDSPHVNAAIPIEVDPAPLEIAFDPHPPACMVRDGQREPIIASQTMADMRTNVQIGPFPERHIRERLREMMDHGINVVACTAMPWLYDDMNRPASNHQGDTFKYALDAARLEGMVLEGWGAYPFDRGANGPIAAWITGRPAGITEWSRDGATISHADPVLPAVNAAVWLYQFRRWGDLYLQTGSGQVPIGVEDTRGWMRQDVNVRHPIGARTVRAFREWVRRKYGRIEDANAAWGTSYESFDRIEPEKDQVANQFGHIWEYVRADHPFHDWNRAVDDLDEFRTEQRVANYRDTLELVRKEIPDAVISLRTEGGNVLAAGLDPRDPNPHLRHIYYSQRRCAAIAEVLQRSGLVKFHSVYITVPYTPSELRPLVRACVAQGIVPMWLPQFDNMRDIAINRRYGSDYQVHFNLPEPRKGYMMHCLTALYPWFKAVYELLEKAAWAWRRGWTSARR